MDGIGEKDFGDMMRLWRECFGDDEAYVRDYLLLWRPKGKSFVKRADGHIVAAADVHLFGCDGTDVAYIFGVMTDGRYRGRGLASSLVAEILESVRNAGCCLAMLIAGDDSLAEWYKGFGFSSRFAEPVSLVSSDGSFDFGTGCSELNRVQFRIADVAAYLALYSERTGSSFSVAVSDSAIEENNGFFTVENGTVLRTANGTGVAVTVSQLADLYPPCLSHFSYVGRRV